MATNIISKRHLDWIDGAKGIAILLVMFAHTHCPDSLVVWIYSFHIPFFFFLSGLTFSPFKYKTREFVSRKFKRLVAPALIFSVIIFVYNVLVGKADLSIRRLVICVISEVLQLRGGYA